MAEAFIAAAAAPGGTIWAIRADSNA